MAAFSSTTRALPLWLRLIHWVIIINFALEIFYGFRMIFWVVVPEGPSGPILGPLGSAASDIPHELMVTRRLYALETWIAIAGLSVYLGITEILPRLLRELLPSSKA